MEIALTVSPYSPMEDYLPTQYCVGTKYEKIETLCLDKIFCLEANFAGKKYFVSRLCPDAILRPDEIFSMDESGVTDKTGMFRLCRIF